jgi:VanZ family protein
MPRRPLHPAVRRAVAVALAAWTVVLAVTLLAPSSAGPSWLVDTLSGILDRLGLPDALVAAERVEFGLNVAAFVPLSLLGTLLWQRPTWRDWTAIGFVASFLVEVVQAVALDGRSATHSDVVANTLGTLLGALLGLALVAALGRTPGSRRSEDRADLPDRHAAAEELEPPR